MKPPHIPIFDPRDPNAPDIDPEEIWDRYLEECDREREDRMVEEHETNH